MCLPASYYITGQVNLAVKMLPILTTVVYEGQIIDF